MKSLNILQIKLENLTHMDSDVHLGLAFNPPDIPTYGMQASV